LPSTRQLADDLRVNRITIENAYRDLEVDGLIYTKAGSGTYVQPQPALAPLPTHEPGADWPLWQQQVESKSETFIDPTPDALVNSATHPQPILFHSGVGDVRQFPADEFRKVLQMVMRRDGIAALDYGALQGYEPLRETISQVLASQGLLTRAENILVTAGSQQALTLVCRLLLNPDDVILVESPTYAGALDLFHALSLRVVGVPVDENGMQVEKLEKLLQQYHPRLIYTIPNFQNPTGVCLSLARRRLLISLADRYNIPILEDDFVGDLRYEGRAQPALKALDPGGRVIYASTFSKMLMPGLRVGFLAAEGPVLDSLVHYKRVTDLSTSSLFQRALESYVTVGRYHAHLRRSSQVYRKRRDAMLAAIDRYLPVGVQVNPPLGGLFIWLRLPEPLSVEKLFPIACEEGVVFARGSRYFPDGRDGDRCMRLNFVAHSPEEIEEGIKRLRKAIARLELGYHNNT
jgi:GntR family transcriptional regulator/MocR family aminotransferase